jgi:hypothetical protein
MDDFWLMIRIFLIVVAWGGVVLLVGYGLEMASRVFSRDDGSGSGPGGTSDKPASS